MNFVYEFIMLGEESIKNKEIKRIEGVFIFVLKFFLMNLLGVMVLLRKGAGSLDFFLVNFVIIYNIGD